MTEGKRFNRIPIRFLLPNLITLLALCSGVTAIRLGIEQRYELAVGAIILATILDAVDGRLARYLKGTSRFGAELDSLADFVNFGVAPGILLYFWSLNSLRTVGWVVVLMLSIGCALRLARFNVALEDPNPKPWAANFFSGIPAPAGAFLALAPMYLGFLGAFDDGHLYAKFIALYIFLIAILLISRVPTFSGKNLAAGVGREYVLPLLAAAALGFVCLIAFPWETLLLLTAIYFLLLPFSMRSAARYRSQEKAEITEPNA
jgi:CDP-diacylglycerol---serine O-phosphatidyltransferase